MSTGLKAFGIIGVGAAIALGISASEPVPAVNSAPSSVVAPKATESKSVNNSVTETQRTTPKIVPKQAVSETKPVSNCHPSYSGCLKMNAGDYDCSGGSGNGPNYTSRVQVYGSDPFDLDRDGDGVGCER